MAAEVAHALLLLSKEHAAVLMSLHPGNASQRRAIGREVQPELAHAARGLMAGWVMAGAGSSGG